MADRHTWPRLTVTVDPKIHAIIKERARYERRTMTSQINHDLERFYGNSGAKTQQTLK